MSAKYGYVGNSPDTTPVRIARRTYNLTGVQTSFTFDAGYSVGYVDVYLNGVKQIENDDFIASNGSTVGFSSAPISGDIVEIVAYKAYDVIQDRNNVAGDFRVYGNVNVGGAVTATSATISGTVTATSFIGNVSGSATYATTAGVSTLAQGLTGTPNIAVGVVTATSFIGNGSGLTNLNAGFKRVITAGISTTLVVGDFCYVSTQGLTITLPASPSIGDRITINVDNFTNTVLERNGKNIQGLSENMTIDVPNATIDLLYLSVTQGWRII